MVIFIKKVGYMKKNSEPRYFLVMYITNIKNIGKKYEYQNVESDWGNWSYIYITNHPHLQWSWYIICVEICKKNILFRCVCTPAISAIIGSMPKSLGYMKEALFFWRKFQSEEPERGKLVIYIYNQTPKKAFLVI